MVTRNVVVTAEQDALLTRLVRTGRYQNVSEAMRAGLRLLEQQEDETAQLRQRLDSGVQQALDGDRAPGSGRDAVQRAFATAQKQTRQQAHSE